MKDRAVSHIQLIGNQRLQPLSHRRPPSCWWHFDKTTSKNGKSESEITAGLAVGGIAATNHPPLQCTEMTGRRKLEKTCTVIIKEEVGFVEGRPGFFFFFFPLVQRPNVCFLQS